MVPAEIALGLHLIYAEDKQGAVRLALGLFALFTAYLVYAHYRLGRPCGCGAGEQFLTSVSAQYVFSVCRNALTLALLGIHQRAHFIPSVRRRRVPSGEADV